MDRNEILRFLQEQIHSVIVATVDEKHLPVTCAVDIMDYDEKGIYILTAKGKNFYNRLKTSKYLALTGMKGEDTTSRIAVSLAGKVKEIGTSKLPELLEKNPYMYEIYRTEESRIALSVFCIYEFHGELFDLSKKPIKRCSFSFGAKTKGQKYYVSKRCNGCGKCRSICPQKCIVIAEKAHIKQENCLRCGNCFTICPIGAIKRKEVWSKRKEEHV